MCKKCRKSKKCHYSCPCYIIMIPVNYCRPITYAHPSPCIKHVPYYSQCANINYFYNR